MGAVHDVNTGYYGAQVKTNGHPDDKLGWIVGAGAKINTPFIGQGDYFQFQVNYTQGALRYLMQTTNSNWGKVNGNSVGFGEVSDAVFGGILANGSATDLQLTTAWNVNAAYEHFWNPKWRTSVYGGYAAVNYGDSANGLLCQAFGGGNASIVGGTAIVANPGCDNNWQTWWIGTRTQWNVTKDFYMGLVSDVDNWSFRFRVHRDFYP